ncbi:putative mannose-6-phosphate isomerase, partial [Serratia symbiotica str. Tucson]|uniref:Mannose-6-phosphate isomerase n=2 Tax=Serratia symbiotica TaxID=138074 RepID=A0A455VFB6_9GAMM
MQKMTNSVQNYAWGSYDALTQLFGITNTNQKPMAELWMGAHPKSPSYVVDGNGGLRSLRELIDEDPSKQLGADIANRFGELPFLFKVLCADQPLSIQVHPSKTAAEAGYAKENAAGIPLDAAERSFKDPNHKPELVFALTPFLAMNGFRTLDDIVSLLQPIADAHQDIPTFLEPLSWKNSQGESNFTLVLALTAPSHAGSLDQLITRSIKKLDAHLTIPLTMATETTTQAARLQGYNAEDARKLAQQQVQGLATMSQMFKLATQKDNVISSNLHYADSQFDLNGSKMSLQEFMSMFGLPVPNRDCNLNGVSACF